MAWEDFGKKLQQLGLDTVSSVQKMGEAVQAGSKLTEAKKELVKAYAALGEAVAGKYAEAPEGLENEYAAIAAAKETVAACEKIVSQIKGVTICPECGRQAGKDERYCSGCGAKLPEKTEEDDADTDGVTQDAGEPEEVLQEEEQTDAAEAVQPAEETDETSADTTVSEDTAAAETAAAETADSSDEETAEETPVSDEAEEQTGASEEHKAGLDIDTEKLKEDVKQAGQAAGEVLNEAADKARVLLGNVTGKAGSFMSGLSTKLNEKSLKKDSEKQAAEDVTAEDIVRAVGEETADTVRETAEAVQDAVSDTSQDVAETAAEAMQSAEALAAKIQAAAEQNAAETSEETAQTEEKADSFEIPIE